MLPSSRAVLTGLLALLALAPIHPIPRTAAVGPPFGLAGLTPAQRDVKLVGKLLKGEYEHLEALYKHLHANPELSLQEEKTALRVAKELRAAGCAVTERVGGYGVVGVLKNGPGPTVLVRCDMDGLPIVEKTGLEHASTVRMRDKNGRETGVMHACGHDVNMTCLVGTARAMAGCKASWSGTLVFAAEPAEEIGKGAKLMLDAGLYRRFPKPDYCLALHCDSQRPYGTVLYREGMALANVDSVDITIKGKGGHGAHPHTVVDPIVLSAHVILGLQTLVSREINPIDPAVVSVGSIHGGSKHNIIPDEVHLQLTVRSTSDGVRKHLLDGIKRIAEGCARAANAPMPEVKVDLAEYTPALRNDVPLTRKMVGLFKEVLGEENVLPREQVMGGEDFARFSDDGKVPIFIYFLGTVAPERVAEAARPGARPLPSLHSDQYHPVIEPTLRTGVTTMGTAVLSLVGKKRP